MSWTCSLSGSFPSTSVHFKTSDNHNRDHHLRSEVFDTEGRLVESTETQSNGAIGMSLFVCLCTSRRVLIPRCALGAVLHLIS